ncbi:hypothetical protein [Paraburkholderia humisilvae]|uniref:Uncharacterized protein n=1 Tax=Paraburkholderia humisilvae TaxID=627669 RepID=A0A6J5FAH3_9BURK|nr:hypothetical protein [Paraburkholderia humisilvae]CAB3774682.1 hypothetical protein LMG29542_08060 [Paraburkholderia humisilvae]
MTIKVSIKHVKSQRYLALSGNVLWLATAPFPWYLNATADEVAKYTFKSCIFYDEFMTTCVASDSGSLDTEFGHTNSLELSGVSSDPTKMFIFSPLGSNDPKAGYPIMVTEGGNTRMLNTGVDEHDIAVPIFGDDDWTDNCGWIVSP